MLLCWLKSYQILSVFKHHFLVTDRPKLAWIIMVLSLRVNDYY